MVNLKVYTLRVNMEAAPCEIPSNIPAALKERPFVTGSESESGCSFQKVWAKVLIGD
jgi:hypothetical protein